MATSTSLSTPAVRQDDQELPGAANRLKSALTSAVNGSPLAPEIASNAFRAVLQPSFDQALREAEAKFREALEAATSSLMETSERVLLKYSATILKLVGRGHETLWNRYVTDYPIEKRTIARHVVRNQIQEGTRCFIQASTTALHLADEMSQVQTRGTLLYTNSIVFPVVAVRDSSFPTVYPFCGPIYDEVCGGWLFSQDDTRTEQELRRLFKRRQDPLRSVFLMPMALLVDSGPHYVKSETAFLARVLMEEADEIVILCPARRIQAERSAKLKPAWPKGWKTNKKVSIVVCGSHPAKELLQNALLDRGLDINWLDASTEWDRDDPWKKASEDPEEFLCHLLERAGNVIRRPDQDELVRSVRAFLDDVFRIYELLKIVRRNSEQSSGAIAQALGISRSALYVRLGNLGLELDDFRTETPDLLSLMQRSTLKETADRLLEGTL